MLLDVLECSQAHRCHCEYAHIYNFMVKKKVVAQVKIFYHEIGASEEKSEK